MKEVERLLEEKRRAELAARIASGEFTVQQPGYVSFLVEFVPWLEPTSCSSCLTTDAILSFLWNF